MPRWALQAHVVVVAAVTFSAHWGDNREAEQRAGGGTELGRKNHFHVPQTCSSKVIFNQSPVLARDPVELWIAGMERSRFWVLGTAGVLEKVLKALGVLGGSAPLAAP